VVFFLFIYLLYIAVLGVELRASCLLAGSLPLDPLHQPVLFFFKMKKKKKKAAPFDSPCWVVGRTRMKEMH
jgi:hypothetical protein